ncbi:SPV043 putative IMV membrane protein [Swinepox virus]|uniref:SPV043 putative IMV membrane protein n=1 Tax=Swinepox virus (strain Swine/Nebraska/17077-99/1999) TaxID=300880 RepID=Q8V3Q1_SWPV1|nr:putative IMV membrane protein [Swinepox virus]AAL69782.1 SPV043 putative IMV membrane protein [Swinepox virus]UED36677.1 putative IMV membrane protein [Swinepox virus]UED36825.1 putative IMV membrane protein [Swinepox virus]UUA44233.1 SPV043 [Swinepox virus]
MTINTKDMFSLVSLTLLTIFMLACGGSLLFKTIAPHRLVITRSVTFNKVVNFLEYVAILIFIPGTITLYSAYVRTLFR